MTATALLTAPAVHPACRGAARLAAATAILLGLVVFVVRGVEAWQAAQIAPGTAVTSGCEQESLFAVWRVAKGDPLYVDRTRPPYAAAYFNWLFYQSYATSLQPFIVVHGGKAVVAGSRLLSAAGAVVGSLILVRLFWAIDPARRLFGASIATWVFCGPLVGWWAHTCRPDVWAMTLEAAGFTVLLLGRRSRPWVAIVVTALLFAAAWSFKQTVVTGFVAAGLFLFARREFRQAAVFAAIGLIVGVASWLALGPAYRGMQLATAEASAFYIAAGWENAISAMAKSTPLAVLAAACAFAAARQRSQQIDPIVRDGLLLSSLAIVIGVPICVLGSCKLGASVNYFFAPSIAIAIGGIAGTRTWLGARTQLVTSAAAIAIHIAILIGAVGEIRLDDQTATMAERWQLFSTLPEPRFSEDTRLELPWLNPHSPPYVLAYLYDDERRRGVRFDAGGIGGLVESGYFASLLLLDQPRRDCYGGALAGYKPGAVAAGMKSFTRLKRVSAPSSANSHPFLSGHLAQRGASDP